MVCCLFVCLFCILNHIFFLLIFFISFSRTASSWQDQWAVSSGRKAGTRIGCFFSSFFSLFSLFLFKRGPTFSVVWCRTIQNVSCLDFPVQGGESDDFPQPPTPPAFGLDGQERRTPFSFWPRPSRHAPSLSRLNPPFFRLRPFFLLHRLWSPSNGMIVVADVRHLSWWSCVREVRRGVGVGGREGRAVAKEGRCDVWKVENRVGRYQERKEGEKRRQKLRGNLTTATVSPPPAKPPPSHPPLNQTVYLPASVFALHFSVCLEKKN